MNQLFLFSIASLLLILLPRSLYAAPIILPVLPLIIALVVKGAFFLFSIFFFVLSMVKKKKKIFAIIGVVLLAVAITLVIIF